MAHSSPIQPTTNSPLQKTDESPIWTEHVTPEGKRYYHNRVTQQSTWERPATFQPLKVPIPPTRPECPWKEYKTAEGRVYYFNQVTQVSSWTIPDEYKASLAEKSLNQAPLITPNPTGISYAPMTDSTTRSTSNDAVTRALQPVVATTKEEAKEIFCELIRAKVTDLDSTWEAAMDKIIDDPRYKVLPVLAERKQTFLEYIEKTKREAEQAQKIAQEKAREGYRALLLESELTLSSNYRKFATSLNGDPRWTAITLSDSEREFLFEEYLYEIEKNTNARLRKEVEESKEKFKELLEQAPDITVRSQWRKIKEKYKDEPCYQKLSNIDRLHIFEAHIRELDRIDAENLRMEREKQKKHSREARAQFRTLLRVLHDKQAFNCRTNWKTAHALVKEEQAFKDMITADGSTPGEIYGDYVEELEELYENDRVKLQEILKNTDFVTTQSTTRQQFDEAMNASDSVAYQAISEEHKQVFFEDTLEDIAKKEKEAQRKQEKLANRFLDHLYNKKYYKQPNISWEDVKKEISSHYSYKDLNDEEKAKQIFATFVAENANNNGKTDRESSEEEGAIPDDKDKSRHSHRSHKSRSKKHKHRRHDDSGSDEDRKKHKRERHSSKSHKRKREESSEDKHSPKRQKVHEVEMGEIVED